MKYIEKLRNSELRPTKQRLQICEVLFDTEKTFHFTINELEQKIVSLVNALKAEREKNEKNTGSVIESQKLSKIEEHVTNMINILDKIDK